MTTSTSEEGSISMHDAQRGLSLLCPSCLRIFEETKENDVFHPHSRYLQDVSKSATSCHLCFILRHYLRHTYLGDGEWPIRQGGRRCPGWDLSFSVFSPDDRDPLRLSFCIWNGQREGFLDFLLFSTEIENFNAGTCSCRFGFCDGSI